MTLIETMAVGLVSIVDAKMPGECFHASMHLRAVENLQLIVVTQSDSVVPSSSRSPRYYGVPIYRPKESRRAVYLSVPLYAGNEMGEPRNEGKALSHCDAKNPLITAYTHLYFSYVGKLDRTRNGRSPSRVLPRRTPVSERLFGRHDHNKV